MKLTPGRRKRLPPSAFAFPKQRKYPINDKAHAKNALARVAAFGSDAEKREVKRKVYHKYPSLRRRH